MKYDNKYDDIINMPHHVSSKHPQMSLYARSAQFAPFAAFTGYEDAINETARETNEKIEIDEELKIILDSKLQILTDRIKQKSEILFTYFVKDQKKKGGKYITITGIVKKIDMYEGCIYLMDNTIIPLNDIIDISGEIFS